MINFSRFLTEELTDSQKETVKKWQANDPHKGTRALEISKHVIPEGEHRITIPVHDPHDNRVEAPQHIRDHLANHGFAVKSYVHGTAIDNYGREVKIAKALSKTKAPKDYVDHFNSDKDRVSARLHNNMQVVVSRHPHDVAGVSTDRNWTSCMNMNDPHNHHARLEHDIHEGTHVAYLTRVGDHEAKNPIARISLKPLNSVNIHGERHTILQPEDRSYGNSRTSFEHTVNEFVNTHFKTKPEEGHVAYQLPDEMHTDNPFTHHTPKGAFNHIHPDDIHKLSTTHQRVLAKSLSSTHAGAAEAHAVSLAKSPNTGVATMAAIHGAKGEHAMAVAKTIMDSGHEKARAQLIGNGRLPADARKYVMTHPNTPSEDKANALLWSHPLHSEFREHVIKHESFSDSDAVGLVTKAHRLTNTGHEDNLQNETIKHSLTTLAKHGNPKHAGLISMLPHRNSMEAIHHIANNHADEQVRGMATSQLQKKSL